METILIPGDNWLLFAKFTRSGHDLILIGPDGKEVVLRDYFLSTPPQDLLTDSGAVIQGELALKLAGPLAPGQFAGPITGQVSIGRVDAVEGKVEVTRSNGITDQAALNTDIFQGDIIVTSADSSIGISFIDDSIFSIGENGRMVIDEMVYDPETQEGIFNTNIVQGVFSFVSGQIAKTGPDSMMVTTPVASIGIRGTKVAGVAAQEGSENTLSLLPETVDGQQLVGEVTVSNQGGSSVLNQMGASLSVTSSFQAPPPPVQLSQAQIQQKFGSTLTTLSKANTVNAEVKTEKATQAAATAKAEADVAQEKAEVAEAVAEESAQEAEAQMEAAVESGDAEAIAEAEVAIEEAAEEMAEAEEVMAEAEAAVAEVEAKVEAVQEAKAVLEIAKQEMEVQITTMEAIKEAAPQEAPVEEAPAQESAPQESESENEAQESGNSSEPVVDEAPIEEGLLEEALLEGELLEEALVEEALIEGAPIEETVVKEAPVDAPVESAPEPVVEEVPAPIPTPAPVMTAPTISPTVAYVVPTPVVFIAPVVAAILSVAPEVYQAPANVAPPPPTPPPAPEPEVPTTYFVTNNTQIILDTDNGTDTVKSSIATYTLPDEIENLEFLAIADTVTSTPGLQAQYYIGTYLGNWSNKTPYKETIDDNLDFSGIWTDSDGDNNLPYSGYRQNSNFTARWQGEIEAPTTGTVEFFSRHDDGGRVKIDDESVFDNWHLQGPRYYNSRGTTTMEEGTKYSFKAEMYERGGHDVMELYWRYDGGSIHIVPDSAFSYVTTTVTNYTGHGNASDNYLQGNDNGGTMHGYEGNDTLSSGAGVDKFYGGDGIDMYRFALATNVTDSIMDWEPQDKIDFSGIVPQTKYVGTDVFSGTESEVRFNSATKQLELDYNADAEINLSINVEAASAGDFDVDTFI